jgi:multicomponent Na+:H+ antiporter subunit B
MPLLPDRRQRRLTGSPTIETLIVNVLLTLMAVTVVLLARSRNLFAVIVLFGTLQLPDGHRAGGARRGGRGDDRGRGRRRHFHRALLGALHLCKSEEAKPAHEPWLPLAVTLATGLVLVYGTWDLPDFPTRRRRSTGTSRRAT